MATFTNYKSSGATANVFTVGAGTTDIIIGCLISNAHATTTAVVDVSLGPSGSQTPIASNVKIPPGGAVELIQGKIVAVANDIFTLAVDTGGSDVKMVTSVLDSV